MSRL
ncbi:hypothetical protein D018_0550A, partial [Vibrio parahaemolyticus VP2007-007]|jgi:hypothetical protein